MPFGPCRNLNADEHSQSFATLCHQRREGANIACEEWWIRVPQALARTEFEQDEEASKRRPSLFISREDILHDIIIFSFWDYCDRIHTTPHRGAYPYLHLHSSALSAVFVVLYRIA
jgi:hypothetical protein